MYNQLFLSSLFLLFVNNLCIRNSKAREPKREAPLEMRREQIRVAPQLLTTSNFIGPWYHAALLFSGLGSIVLLFGVLFSQQIREDLVRAATSPANSSDKLRMIAELAEHHG